MLYNYEDITPDQWLCLNMQHDMNKEQELIMPTNRAVYCADGEQMPNWCMNEVSMSGGKSDMEDFLAEFCEEDPSQKGRYRFVYDQISPMEEPEPDETGFSTIESQRDAWGCKWEMTDYALTVAEENWGDKDWMHLDGNYDTAWGPPYKIYDRIVEIIEERDWDIEFNEWFFKEPGMQIAGWLPE